MSWTRFVENNEGEGETWTFWIRTEGNESELARLAEIVDSLVDVDEQFAVLDPVDISYDQIDALVTYGGEGYMRLHTKLPGRLRLPDEAPKTGAYPEGDWFPFFYKGGIAKFIHADREDRS